MFRNFLYLTLAMTLLGTGYIFYLSNLAQHSNAYQSDLYPIHPNLVKESAIILDLGSNGIILSPLNKLPNGSSFIANDTSHTFFDMDNDGFAELTSWTKGDDGFLVFDKNGDGKIESQSEFFGKDIKYRNGFIKLEDFDNNNDKKISKDDINFSTLKVWIDKNSDGQSAADEIKGLSELGIEQIDLQFTRPAPEFNVGNPIKFIGKYSVHGVQRYLQEIELQKSNVLTHYIADVSLDARVLFLPTLKGFGNLPDLHVAMSKDKRLLEAMINFVKLADKDFLLRTDALDSQILKILFLWADSYDIPGNSRGAYVDAKRLNFMEKLTGARFGEEANYPYSDPQNMQQGKTTNLAFSGAFNAFKAFLVTQVIAEKLYDRLPVYNLASGDMTAGHLSLSGIKYIQEMALSVPAENRRDFWISISKILIQNKKPEQFEEDEVKSLSEAINNSLPNENWATISLSAQNALKLQ